MAFFTLSNWSSLDSEIAAIVFGYGSIASKERLSRGNTPERDLEIFPVLFTPESNDGQLYRAYGLPLISSSKKKATFPNRTLGVYNEQQLPSGVSVPDTYQLSGVIVPLTYDELLFLTESEGALESPNQFYTVENLSAHNLSAFDPKDTGRLEGLLDGHEKVSYYYPVPEYQSPTDDEGIPLSYIALVIHGAIEIDPSGEFATHMLDNTLDQRYIIDDVSNRKQKSNRNQITQHDIKFITQYFESHNIELITLTGK